MTEKRTRTPIQVGLNDVSNIAAQDKEDNDRKGHSGRGAGSIIDGGEENMDFEDAHMVDDEHEASRTQSISGVHVVDTSGGETFISETFEGMGVREDILRGIYAMGYEKPSPIQMTAITPMIKKRDIRAQAQSGTGKTATFGIASLQTADPASKDVQVLILETTRELAIQTTNVIKKLGQYTNVRVEAIYGGVRTDESVEKLRSKPQIVVGTPGRIMHLHELSELDLNKVKLLILDEADEMLKRGFVSSVNDIYSKIPEDTIQVAMFSATWGKEEQAISKEILCNPVIISLKDEDQTLKGIKQFYVDLGDKRGSSLDLLKLEALSDIYSRAKIAQSVVFCNRIERAIYLYESLMAKGFVCGLFHSEMTQDERNKVMNDFRKSKFRVLVSSGLLSRGVDIQTLSVVINFDIPGEREMENYIHRIGRAGRFGRKGTAINLVSKEELATIKKYEEYYNTTIAPLPSVFDDLE